MGRLSTTECTYLPTYLPTCIGDHGKRHPEPWKQPVTGKPVHGPGGGRLPSRVAPLLKPQR